MKRFILMLLFALPIVANAQRGAYVLKLNRVEVNGKSEGKIAIDSLKPSQLMFYASEYTDSQIGIIFKFSRTAIPFVLTNKGTGSLAIDWNAAAYIDQMGTSRKVMHQGVKFIDRNQSQPETNLIAGSNITDRFTPTDNVHFEGGAYGSGWEAKDLFPELKKKETPSLAGKQVKIYMPITINGNKQEYIFTFEIVFNDYIKK